jgi:hypothetical protein
MVRILCAAVASAILVSASPARAHELQCEKVVGVVQTDSSGAPVLVGGLPVFVGTPGATLELREYPVTIGFGVHLQNLDASNVSTINALEDTLADAGIASTPFGDQFGAGFTLAPGESGQSIATIRIESREACLALLGPIAASGGASCPGGVFDNRFTVLHDSGMAECRARVICEPPVTEPCPQGQTRCGGACVDVQSDEANCGACGSACGAGQTCDAGQCTSACAPATEVCNGVDDDCDGQVDEGFDVGAACDGADADACAEGVFVCSSAGTATCSDVTGDSVEVCGNGVDDDCDGQVDEGCAAGCTAENAATACNDGNPCTFDACEAGSCVNSNAPFGMPCGSTACGAPGSCVFETGVCDQTGTAVRTCSTPTCNGLGACVPVPSEQTVSCSRSTEGDTCGVFTAGCPPGTVAERCCSNGTCSSLCSECI